VVGVDAHPLVTGHDSAAVVGCADTVASELKIAIEPSAWLI
jgi:hypothetical protein